MTEMMTAFLIWCVVGCFMFALGLYSFFAKNPTGFWASEEVFQVTNIKRYNWSMAEVFCAVGIVFILLGLPLLFGQDTVWILFSIVGVMVEVIASMVIYTLGIEKKYKAR